MQYAAGPSDVEQQGTCRRCCVVASTPRRRKYRQSYVATLPPQAHTQAHSALQPAARRLRIYLARNIMLKRLTSNNSKASPCSGVMASCHLQASCAGDTHNFVQWVRGRCTAQQARAHPHPSVPRPAHSTLPAGPSLSTVLLSSQIVQGSNMPLIDTQQRSCSTNPTSPLFHSMQTALLNTPNNLHLKLRPKNTHARTRKSAQVLPNPNSATLHSKTLKTNPASHADAARLCEAHTPSTSTAGQQ